MLVLGALTSAYNLYIVVEMNAGVIAWIYNLFSELLVLYEGNAPPTPAPGKIIYR